MCILLEISLDVRVKRLDNFWTIKSIQRLFLSVE